MDLKLSSKSIDWVLSVKLANNKPELATELLSLLIDDLPKIRDIINQAFETQDYEAMHQQVHKLHGASCYCGVPRLKEISAHFETKLKRKDKKSFSNFMKLLNSEIERILSEYSVLEKQIDTN